MNRLNSGNVGIFYSNEFHSNLKNWVKSALQIFQNDINIAHEHGIVVFQIEFLTFAWAITDFELIEVNFNFRSLKFNLFMVNVPLRQIRAIVKPFVFWARIHLTVI